MLKKLKVEEYILCVGKFSEIKGIPVTRENGASSLIRPTSTTTQVRPIASQNQVRPCTIERCSVTTCMFEKFFNESHPLIALLELGPYLETKQLVVNASRALNLRFIFVN